MARKPARAGTDYLPGKRNAIPNADVVAMIAANRQAQGITPRQIADEEIVQRLVFSLVNEAAHILEEGIATKASDIDVVYIFGYGFPVHRGGPLRYANEVGLFNVVAAMQRFANSRWTMPRSGSPRRSCSAWWLKANRSDRTVLKGIVL